MRRSPRGGDRERLAVEAARLMAEEHTRDFLTAKRKAAERLGLEQKDWPTNAEIEAALRTHLALFHGHDLPGLRAHLHDTAVAAMTLLARFDPRAVGAAVTGNATAGAEVELHLCADEPEQVALTLAEAGIPFQVTERRLRFGGQREQKLPAMHFYAGPTGVMVVIFTWEAMREAPLSPVDGHPMRRVALRDLTKPSSEPDRPPCVAPGGHL